MLIEEKQISMIAFRPLYEGLLLDKYKKENPPQFENGDHRKGLPRFSYENLAKLESKLNKIKEKFGSSTEDLSRVAQQFVLKYKFTAAVIPGFRNLQQVKINLAAMDKPITDDEFEFVKRVFE
jgi:aryl-alcohol dehydrogenase-like predicted oxidoreductase